MKIKNDHLLQKCLETFKKEHPDKKILYLYLAGSHFFDIHTKDSDLDIKGIYMPSLETFGKKNPKLFKKVISFKTNEFNKNTKDDIDFDLFSLPHFLTLLRDGDFNMMEALYAPEDKIIFESPLITELKQNRNNLLTSNIYAFLGFFKQEYKRHSVNNQFYSTRKKFKKFLENIIHEVEEKQQRQNDREENLQKGELRLNFHRDRLNRFVSENKDHFLIKKVSSNKQLSFQEVIEFSLLQFPVNNKMSDIVSVLDKHLSKTGHRKKEGSTKGLSHCLRLLFEAQDIFLHGEFKFPFSEDKTQLLKDIKTGKLNNKEIIANIIEKELMRVKKLENNHVSVEHKVKYTLNKYINNLKAKMEILNIINKSQRI